MRVRMIRPAYWTDADLHKRLTAEVREFYIGLWMLADDAGYVSWDVERVGAELFAFRSNAWRLKRIPEWIQLLGSHVRVLECGRHLVVPNLPKYQACPKPSYQNQRAHDVCLRHMAPHGTTGDPGAPQGDPSPVLSDVRKPRSHMAPAGTTGGQRAPAQEGGLVGKEGKGSEGGSRRATNGASTDDEERSGGDLVKAFAALGLPRPQPMAPAEEPPADAPAESWFEPPGGAA